VIWTADIPFTWLYTLIWTEDCSVYLTGHTYLDWRLFCLLDWTHLFGLKIVLFTWLDTLIWTVDFPLTWLDTMIWTVDFLFLGYRHLFALRIVLLTYKDTLIWTAEFPFTSSDTLIWTADCSVYLTGHTYFDCGLFCLYVYMLCSCIRDTIHVYVCELTFK
jgi:hypothetical protein